MGKFPLAMKTRVFRARGALTEVECEEVVQYAILAGMSFGVTEGGLALDTRHSNVVFLGPLDLPWLQKRVGEIMRFANKHLYNGPLVGNEMVQISRYGPDDHYSWHTDSGGERTSRRVLSLVIQLSDPHDYVDGDLEIGERDNRHGTNYAAPRDRGSVVVFPSDMEHCAHRIRSGERFSAVAWGIR